MKVNVGDYVITNDRLHIGKIYNINEFREPSMMYAIDFSNADDFIFMGENDFKSSPDITDLIEVGDYVNGGKVYKKEKGYIVINADFGRIFEFMNIYEKDIKSIVTYEMFESMEYKVGEV